MPDLIELGKSIVRKSLNNWLNKEHSHLLQWKIEMTDLFMTKLDSKLQVESQFCAVNIDYIFVEWDVRLVS